MLKEPDRDMLAALATIVGDGGMIAGDSPDAVPYLTEPRDRWHGRAAAILRPRATSEVAAIVRLCAERRVGVIAYSGGTGLVGGQMAETGPEPVVVSLERLTRLRAVLPEDGAMIVEAGVTLAEARAAAAAAGRLYPLSLASEGSCRIGGNLATNAGGVQVLRYGNARDLCLGIEAVMADGSVVDDLKVLRKDNTGYDLRHLLIGSEGTLGIITAAALKLFPIPGETVTAMLAVPSPAASVSLLHAVRDRLGEGITAFELIGDVGMEYLYRFHPERSDPLSGQPRWRVLLEVAGPEGAGLAARAEHALAAVIEAGLASDGILAASEAQRAGLWWVRETIPECNRRVGSVSSHDLSVPMSHIAAFIEEGLRALAALDPGLRVNCFGHVGDGNLHYNVFPADGRRREDYEHLRGEVKRVIHDLVHAHGGSVSAEHGIGRLKTAELVKYGDPGKLAAMRAIKRALDPLGILNPGAVIAAELPG